MHETSELEILELREQIRFSKSVFEIASSFVSLKQSDETINLALKKLGQACRAGRAYLFLFHEDHILMDNTHEWCARGVLSQRENLQDLPIAMFPWWITKLQNKELIHIQNVLTMPVEASAEQAILQEQDIRSILVLPVFIKKELMGFIGLDNVQSQGSWTKESMDYLAVAGKIIGSTLTREKMQDLLKAQNRELAEVNQHLKETQQQLIESEKMAAIGRLAGGVAHEINNPAAFVSTNLHTLHEYLAVFKQMSHHTDALLKNEQTLDKQKTLAIIEEMSQLHAKEDIPFLLEDSFQLMDESLEGLERIKNIVQSLNDFARPDRTPFHMANINTAIEKAVERTREKFHPTCIIEKHFGNLPNISCRCEELTRMFMHLLTNAAQAMENGGVLTIESRVEQGSITIIFCDTGKGIDAEHMQTLFDPFFTTQDVNKGTGLGLAIAQTIIQNHGGTIHAESQKNKGACFFIQIPNPAYSS